MAETSIGDHARRVAHRATWAPVFADCIDGPGRELVSSPDGRLLLLTGVADPAYVWDLRSGQAYAPPIGGHTPQRLGQGYMLPIHRASFLDDRTVIEVSLDGVVRRWRIAVPMPPSELRAWVNEATDLLVDPGALGEMRARPIASFDASAAGPGQDEG